MAHLRSSALGALTLLGIVLVVACSDDVKPLSDAARDRAAADLGRDLGGGDRSSLDSAPREQGAGDSKPPLDGKPGLDGKPPLDSKPGLDKTQADLGQSKLLIWTLCSTNTKCKPYCGAIGSKSEGWYDPCTTQLMTNPLTSQPYWDQCASCVVTCDAIGSFSEGWYAHCP